jgi:hypothetical protein
LLKRAYTKKYGALFQRFKPEMIMKQLKTYYLLLFVTYLYTLFSCQPDKDLLDARNGNAAAAHLKASEKLVIPAAIDLPTNLPGGNVRVATYYAEGVQKYKAVQKGNHPVTFEWALVAPDAILYDFSNAKKGTHGAGPFWALSPTDSVFGQHFNPVRTAPSPDAGSIDWLLLKPKSGTTPTGVFANVAYIQRIATKGGKAPLTPPLKITDTVAIQYKAVYRFSEIAP